MEIGRDMSCGTLEKDKKSFGARKWKKVKVLSER